MITFRYEGLWKNDVYHGEGQLQIPKDYSYQGQFNMGIMEGSGRLELKDGTVVKGGFQKGVPWGEVELQWPNGDSYTGDMRQWKKEGKGDFFKKGEFRHIGEFSNDKENGYGKRTVENGVILIGKFRLGKKVGDFVRVDPSKGKHRFIRFQPNGYDYIKVNFREGDFDDPFFSEYVRSFKMDVALNFVLQNNLQVVYRVFDGDIEDFGKKSTINQLNGATDSEDSSSLEASIEEPLRRGNSANKVAPFRKAKLRNKSSLSSGSWVHRRQSSRFKTSLKLRGANLSKNVSMFNNIQILEAFRDGNLDRIRAIYMDIRRGRRSVLQLIRLRDRKKQTIFHLAGSNGHHIVLLHLCCLLKMIQRDSKKFDPLSILKQTDCNGATVLELVAKRGFYLENGTATLDHSDFDNIDHHYGEVDRGNLTLDREIGNINLFQRKDSDLKKVKGKFADRIQAAKVRKDYLTLIEDGEKEIAQKKLTFAVVSKRAFCMQVLKRLYSNLSSDELFVREADYKGKNSPLHWAFYWADIFAIITLLESDFRMVFWRNQRGEGPPELMKQNAENSRQDQSTAIFCCIIDELFRVLYYKFVKEGYFQLDPSEDIGSGTMDDRFLGSNTGVESVSFIFEDRFLCKSLLRKFYSQQDIDSQNSSPKKGQKKDTYLFKLLDSFSRYFKGRSKKLEKFKSVHRDDFAYLFALTISVMTSADYDVQVIDILEIDPFKLVIYGKSIFHLLCMRNEARCVEAIINQHLTHISSQANRKKYQKKEDYKSLLGKMSFPEPYYGNTPVHLAIIYRSFEVLEVLLQYDVNLQKANYRGWNSGDLLQNLTPYMVNQSQLIDEDRIMLFVKNYLISAQKYFLKNDSLLRTWEALGQDENLSVFRRIIQGKLHDAKVIAEIYREGSVFFGVDLSKIEGSYRGYFKQLSKEFEYIQRYLKEEYHLYNINIEDAETRLIKQVRSIQDRTYSEPDKLKQCLMRSFYASYSKIDLSKPIPLSLASKVVSNRIYCFQVQSENADIHSAPLFEKLLKLRARYQHLGGGIKIEVIKGRTRSRGMLYRPAQLLSKIAPFLFKNWFFKSFAKFTFYYVVSLSDELLQAKAFELDLNVFNMHHSYFSSFKESMDNFDNFEPLRDFQKQNIILTLVNEVLNVEEYENLGLISQHFKIHDYSRRSSIYYEHQKNAFKFHCTNILSLQGNLTKLRTLPLISFYFSDQQGYFVFFLVFLLNWQLLLVFISAVIILLRYLFGQGVFLNEDNGILAGLVGLWSAALYSALDRKEAELNYCHDKRLMTQADRTRKALCTSFIGNIGISDIDSKVVQYNTRGVLYRRIMVS